MLEGIKLAKLFLQLPNLDIFVVLFLDDNIEYLFGLLFKNQDILSHLDFFLCKTQHFGFKLVAFQQLFLKLILQCVHFIYFHLQVLIFLFQQAAILLNLQLKRLYIVLQTDILRLHFSPQFAQLYYLLVHLFSLSLFFTFRPS